MNENLGIVMVFTLVSAAQEWLNVQWDKIKLNREENDAKKLREEEEAEQVYNIEIPYSFSMLCFFISLIIYAFLILPF